jgi:phage terminase small subunit
MASPKTAPKTAYPSPAADLSPDAVVLWHQIHKKWALDEARCAVLVQALYSFDRAEQARKALNEHGLVSVDRYGRVHPRPEVRTEETSRGAFLQAMRHLGLDVVPPARGKGA